MNAPKSRQRGHGDYGFLLWLIASIPYLAGAIAAAVVGLVLWWMFR